MIRNKEDLEKHRAYMKKKYYDPNATCVDCGEGFRRKQNYQTRCYSCWKKFAVEQWKRQGQPARLCKECGEGFIPEEGWERTCRSCSRGANRRRGWPKDQW